MTCKCGRPMETNESVAFGGRCEQCWIEATSPKLNRNQEKRHVGKRDEWTAHKVRKKPEKKPTSEEQTAVNDNDDPERQPTS